MLSGNDPFCMIDLDSVVAGGKVSPFALKIIEYFNSYTELSPSGTGIRIIVMGSIPAAIKREDIEVYDRLRQMSLTGHPLNHLDIRYRQKKLKAVFKRFGRKEITPKFNKDHKFSKEFHMPRGMIRAGSRSNALAGLLGIMIRKGVSHTDSLEYAFRISRENMSKPLSDKEVRDIHKSIWKCETRNY
jgi:hypothetical protein